MEGTGVDGNPQTPILEEESPATGVHAGTTRVDRLLKERIRRNRSHQLFDYDEASYDGPLDFVNGDGSASERLVVVANRLPVTCSKDQHGHWQLQVSAGGLVSALKGVSTYTTMWIGWPGIWVKPGRERDALTAMLVQEGCIPVWIDPTLLDMYYNGFCNSVLWQLFHYVPLNIDSWQKMSEHRAMQMQWQAYQVANQKFADVVLENYLPNDIMWIQDYHLMVLPSLLKASVPKMKVGFFLHTPFPSSEMYRTLPVREEVLRAVLGADLIGFHTYDYARHFISSCTRILGLEGTPEGVENNGTICRVGTFPIGIDPERFTHALETDEVQSHVAKLLNRYAGRKIMLGVDRLDMVKGIPQKLLAFEKFLEEHPEWRDKVLLVQIAVPSRTDVSEYQKLRSMVHEIVGRINGQFGTLTYVPIYHLDTSLSFTELCALYAVTDVALVTSLRDGMNLVSYEYVACQSDNAGVLVLSEFAGAAQSLGAGAILVNPWNITDMAQAIEDSLCMSEEERRERHRQNYMHVQTHTAQHWADTFISELNDTHIEADLRMKHAPPPLNMQEVVQAYKNSSKRLIVLGYNATLTSNTDAPINRAGGMGTKRSYQEQLGKSQAKVNPKILASLQELCRDPNNVLVIFSGSETHKLEEIFGELPVWLAAENGVFVRPPPQHLPPGQQHGKRQWRALFHGIGKDWMESVQLVFDYFCERTPRSSVEVRETSLVWNYKYADVEFGRIQARDLLQHLWTGPISNAPVEIIQGGKSVEVRPVSVTKGMSTQRMVGLMAEVYGIEGVTFDFVLCIGHLLGRDENMYSFFEGVKVDGATGTGAVGEGGRKGSAGAPTLPAATQAQQLLQALHKQHQHYYHHLPPSLQQPGTSTSSHASKAPPSPYPPTTNSHTPAHSPSHSTIPLGVHAATMSRADVGREEGAHAKPPSLGLPEPASAGAKPQGQLQVELEQQQQRQQEQEQEQRQQLQQRQQLEPASPPALTPAQLSHPKPMHATRPLTIPALVPPCSCPPSSTTPAAAHGASSQPNALGASSRAEGHSSISGPGAMSAQESLRMMCSASAPPHQDGHMLPRQPGVSEPGTVAGTSSPSAQARKSWGGGGPDWENWRECGTPASMDSYHGFKRDIKQQYSPQELPDCFPPRYLYTCTVGRNRSKARFALSAASEVSDLLDSIVQQAIYHHQPPTLPPHPYSQPPEGSPQAGACSVGGMDINSRMQSFSSTEPLSPDSMFTLINSWKNFRTAGTGTTTSMAAGADPLPPPGPILPASVPIANSVLPSGASAPPGSMPGPDQAPVTLPPSSLQSHASGSVVNSWALGAAVASHSQLQQQQQQQQGHEVPPPLPPDWHLPSHSPPAPTCPRFLSTGQAPDYLQQLALLGGSNTRLSEGSACLDTGCGVAASSSSSSGMQPPAGSANPPAALPHLPHYMQQQQHPHLKPSPASSPQLSVQLPAGTGAGSSPHQLHPSPHAHHSPHSPHHHHISPHAQHHHYQPPLPTHHEQVPSNYPVDAPLLSEDASLPSPARGSPARVHHLPPPPQRAQPPLHHPHNPQQQRLDVPLPHALPHAQPPNPSNAHSPPTQPSAPSSSSGAGGEGLLHAPPLEPKAPPSGTARPPQLPYTATPQHHGSSTPDFQQLLRSQQQGPCTGASSCPIPMSSPEPTAPNSAPKPAPTHTQHGPICAPPPPPAAVEHAASTTLYCPMPTGPRAPSPVLSAAAAQPGAPPQQEAPTTTSAPAHTAPTSVPKPCSSQGTPQDEVSTAPPPDDALALLRNLARVHLGSSSRSVDPASGHRRSNQGSTSFSRQSTGSTADLPLPGSPLNIQTAGGKHLASHSGRSSSGRISRVTSEGLNLDSLAQKMNANTLEQQVSNGSPTASRAGQLGGILVGGARQVQPQKPPPLPYIPPQPFLQQQQQQQQQGGGEAVVLEAPEQPAFSMSPTAGESSKGQFLVDELARRSNAAELSNSPTSEMGGDIGFTSKGSLVAGYETLDKLDAIRDS